MMKYKFFWFILLTTALAAAAATTSSMGEARNGFINWTSSASAVAENTRASNGPRVTIRNLADNMRHMNSSANIEHGIWVLIPNNLTESQLTGTNFDLFKLDTDQLFSSLQEDNPQHFSDSRLHEHETDSSSNSGGTDQVGVFSPGEPRFSSRRESRKMKFFPNFMKKPKVSPLYLVNGTVCRFVNSQPICTTLSTTGLFGNARPILNNNGQFPNGLFQQLGQQGQQLQNQFPQQGQGQQGQGQQQQLQQGQNQFQQGGQQRQTTPNQFQG